MTRRWTPATFFLTRFVSYDGHSAGVQSISLDRNYLLINENYLTGKRHVIGWDDTVRRLITRVSVPPLLPYTYLRIPPDDGRVHRSPLSPPDDGSGYCIVVGYSFFLPPGVTDGSTVFVQTVANVLDEPFWRLLSDAIVTLHGQRRNGRVRDFRMGSRRETTTCPAECGVCVRNYSWAMEGGPAAATILHAQFTKKHIAIVVPVAILKFSRCIIVFLRLSPPPRTCFTLATTISHAGNVFHTIHLYTSTPAFIISIPPHRCVRRRSSRVNVFIIM